MDYAALGQRLLGSHLDDARQSRAERAPPERFPILVAQMNRQRRQDNNVVVYVELLQIGSRLKVGALTM